MAGTMTFDLQALKALAEHAKSAKEHNFGADVLWDKRYHANGKLEKDEAGWPKRDNIDPNRTRPGMLLVKDHGIYLMSTGLPRLPLGSNAAYAIQADPTLLAFDDWWDVARRIMGGDDRVITIFGLHDAVLEGVRKGAKFLHLNVTGRDITARVSLT